MLDPEFSEIQFPRKDVVQVRLCSDQSAIDDDAHSPHLQVRA
ncbi:hypothetical protein [Saccharopolyspora sp. NPDC050642]